MTFTTKLMHEPERFATGDRTGGFYQIKHTESGASCRIQGNVFSSCGINTLYDLSGLYDMPVEELDNFLKYLANFVDTAKSVGTWKARRYLIQPSRHQSPFLNALLSRCEKLCEYENLAHSSGTQYLYMLALPPSLYP